jgi:hypothetical protein
VCLYYAHTHNRKEVEHYKHKFEEFEVTMTAVRNKGQQLEDDEKGGKHY